MKIDFTIIPPVTPAKTTAASNAAGSAVAGAQKREAMREDSRKKRVSQTEQKSESSALPKFSNLVARELSSRLASEVQKHEHDEDENEDEKNPEPQDPTKPDQE